MAAVGCLRRQGSQNVALSLRGGTIRVEAARIGGIPLRAIRAAGPEMRTNDVPVVAGDGAVSTVP